MKQYFITAIVAMMTALTASAQLGFGLRDTRYVNINYTFASHFNAQLEHSVYSEKFKQQHIRLAVSYTRQIGKFTLQGQPYFGTVYSGTYYDLGAFLSAGLRLANRVELQATLNPHYDSGLDYETCYRFGAACRVYKELSIVAQYSTIPEYRQSEKRIRAGVKVDFDRLSVCPLLSIPVGKDDAKSVRVAVSAQYHF